MKVHRKHQLNVKKNTEIKHTATNTQTKTLKKFKKKHINKTHRKVWKTNRNMEKKHMNKTQENTYRNKK